MIDISEVVKRTGLAASTIRYYEQIGLIHSPGRHGLKRIFKSNVIEQLDLIKLGQNAGFSLDEISQMFSNSGQAMIDRNKLKDQANKIDEQIRKLTAMRDGLLHAANCPASSHLECPRFQKLLRVNRRLSTEST